jgi:beta-glucosidase
MVLLNTSNILPLATASNKIFVAGKTADDIGLQSGGWTISWQGGSGTTTPGTSILQGIRNTVPSSTIVTFNATGSGIDSSYRVAIAVIGETPYAEGAGDRPGSMSLDSTDINTLNTLRAGVPVVVVLVSGRPLDIAAQLPTGRSGRGVATRHRGPGRRRRAVRRRAADRQAADDVDERVSRQPINDGDGQTRCSRSASG